ncbi:MAG: hypothetical protein DHS20C21_07240 [Gemmatimonadota bacterium]|nr:MAG: hypothetical protein DHS20C21_07240 [Gemmatimonadota bacterium]
MNTTDQTPDEFDLAQLDDEYAAASGEDQFESIPDGTYPAIVEQVELKRSKTSNRKMLEWELRITSGECEGRKLWKYTLLETPENLVWAKKDFNRVGLQLAKLSDLPSRLGELLDVRVEITKKTKGDYDGVYFRGRLEGSVSSGDRPF